MIRRAMRHPTLVALPLFAALLAIAPPARAAACAATPSQSQSDLQKEVDRLRTENDQLKQQLADALERLKKLEAEKAAPPSPTSTDGASGQAAPAEAPEVVPADPSLGPGGLLALFQADYLAAFSSAPAPPASAKDRTDFELHLKKLANWCEKENRENIKTLTWPGRIDPNSVRASGRSVAMDLLFRNGKREFRVPVTVNDTMLAKVRRGDLMDFGNLSITALVRPRVRVDASRPAPGAFEVPPMVGPYLTFAFDYEVKSLVPAEQAAPKAGR